MVAGFAASRHELSNGHADVDENYDHYEEIVDKTDNAEGRFRNDLQHQA